MGRSWFQGPLPSSGGERLGRCNGFEWDEGNLDKSWEKQGVAFWEAEEVFFNQPFLVHYDEAHSQTEERFYALGKTEASRLLFIVCTIRLRSSSQSHLSPGGGVDWPEPS